MVGIISLDLHSSTEWVTFISNSIFRKRNLRPRRVRYRPKVERQCHAWDLPTKPLSPQLTLDVLRLISLSLDPTQVGGSSFARALPCLRRPSQGGMSSVAPRALPSSCRELTRD